MKSMTGFGISNYADEELTFAVEIKTINHRYRDLDFRLSRQISSLEENIRKMVCDTVRRGHCEISIKYRKVGTRDLVLTYNPEAAKNYMDIVGQVKADYQNINDDFSLTDLLAAPDVITNEEPQTDMEKLWAKLSPVLQEALVVLDRSRTEEGERLKLDFIKRIEIIKDCVAKISDLSDQIPKKYYEELKKRVEDYCTTVISEDRFLSEIALYADRVNITEELVRLSSHMENFKKLIESDEPNGRKMDFLFQEINREANTIASKSNSFEISTLVVEIKSELEKMREQIQNIE